MIDKAKMLKSHMKNILTLRHESLEEEDNKHDVSLKPFVGTLRVESPSGRAWPAAGSESCVVAG